MFIKKFKFLIFSCVFILASDLIKAENILPKNKPKTETSLNITKKIILPKKKPVSSAFKKFDLKKQDMILPKHKPEADIKTTLMSDKFIVINLVQNQDYFNITILSDNSKCMHTPFFCCITSTFSKTVHIYNTLAAAIMVIILRINTVSIITIITSINIITDRT